MGVYINMEMPKDGVYWCEIGVAGEIATITIHGVCGDPYREDRKAFPLIHIPPHGDLIDRDEQIERAWRLNLSTRELIEEMLKTAPTIIPAEPPKEET